MSSSALVAAVLSALNASPDRGAPEGHIYAALMSGGLSLAAFQALVSLLVKSGLATSSGHYLTLTDKGAALAAQCDAILVEAKGVRS